MLVERIVKTIDFLSTSESDTCSGVGLHRGPDIYWNMSKMVRKLASPIGFQRGCSGRRVPISTFNLLKLGGGNSRIQELLSRSIFERVGSERTALSTSLAGRG